MKAVRSFALMIPLATSGLIGAVPGTAAAQGTAQAQTVTAPTVHLQTARLWRGDGVSLLEGVVSTPVGSGSTANPQVELVISDSTGQVLHTESWTDTVSQQLLQMASGRSDVALSTPVRVNVRPGTYNLTVRVRRGGQVDSVRSQVVAFGETPVASDLIVSNAIRAVGAEEGVASAETRIGRFGIVRTARPAIEPTNPTLWYYLELYRRPGEAADTTAQLEFTVVPATGGAPLLRTTRTVRLSERGGSDAARLPLQGLPPGEYLLRVNARIGARAEQREANFAMASFAAEPIAAPVAAAPSGGSSEELIHTRYFAAGVMTDTAVSRLAEALHLAPLADAFPAYAVTADTDTKRRALARYFARIADPVPSTAEHELLEEYQTRAEYVAREFAERDLKRSGLRTDRGRIFMKYGKPDAQQLVPLGSASRGAVELWKYNRLRGMKYAFLDETGFQHFYLIYTTDPTAQSLPDWQARVVDRQTIQMIQSF